MKWLMLGAALLVLVSCGEPAKSQEITISPPGTPDRTRPDTYREREDYRREQRREQQAREWDRRHCHLAGPVRVCQGTNPFR